jgi:hypothetical protein
MMVKKLNILFSFFLFVFFETGHAQPQKAVSPMLTTGWSQACYYNDSCPEDVNGSCGHARTGCGATAMAQILKYFNYPENGIGQHSYIDPDYGVISADFENANYAWEDMPDILNSSSSPEEVAAVAQLMAHCGVAVEMDYAAGSSYSGTTSLRNAFYDFFGYSSKAQLLRNSHFPDSTWKQILIDEIDDGRPVFYGISSGSGGHFIVLDGYTDDGYFHFNWGYGSGYYKKLSELPVVQEAIIGIEPIPEVNDFSVDFVARFNRFDDGSGVAGYGNNLLSGFLIEPPGADSIALFFSKFDTQSGNDYFRVYDGNSALAPLLGEFCGNILPPCIISSSEKIYVEFVTDDTVSGNGWELGYSAFVPGAVSGLHVIKDTLGTFDDGSGAAYYQSHVDAYWLIEPPGASSVTISFDSFNTEFSCDYLWVYDGDNISPTNLLGVYSGASLPPSLTAGSGKMLLHFNTDFSTTRQGWGISFNSGFEKTRIDVKAFLEGAFNGTNMETGITIPLSQPFNNHPWNYYGNEKTDVAPSEDIIDWILMELRDAPDIASATSETIIARKALFLRNDGAIRGISGEINDLPVFPVQVNDSLFVVIRHRNHLAVISAKPLQKQDSVYVFDFTTGFDKVYGGDAGYKQLSSTVWGMVSGDINADGRIDTTEVLSWRTYAGAMGYLNADVNLDAQVENRDKDGICIENVGYEVEGLIK